MKIYDSQSLVLWSSNQSKKMTKITVAKGDGIGPEIMDATLKIILAAGAEIEIEEITVGECHYKDVSIDGDYTSKYILVQPVEIKKIEYVEYV